MIKTLQHVRVKASLLLACIVLAFSLSLVGGGSASAHTLTNCSQINILCPNQVMYPGTYNLSASGVYKFTLQTDGNLVLYNLNSGRPIWASNTVGQPVKLAIMQGDGNLVLYNYNYNPVWASNTAGNSNAWMIVQNDGNVVIYSWSGSFSNDRALWATGTNGE